MINIATSHPWLMTPTVRGSQAVLYGAAAVILPTLIRASVIGIVPGCETTAYFPFILMSAIFLGWRYAVIVTLVSAAIIDALFIGSPNQILESASDYFGIGFFLTSSVMIIGFVYAIRRTIADRLVSDRRAEPGTGIIFSLEGGQAWASWNGTGSPVRLGPETEVAEMMQDFLAQVELARRLSASTR